MERGRFRVFRVKAAPARVVRQFTFARMEAPYRLLNVVMTADPPGLNLVLN